MIYEVRDYHYRPDIIDRYKQWAREAVVVLRDKLDVVGFWIDEATFKPEITGRAPVNSPIGAANVTWIIRWDNKEARDATMRTAFTGSAWDAVMAKHPDPEGYLQISSRFMEAM